VSRLASLVLVETSSPGNLGAALRVAANFGVPRVRLIAPRTDPDGEEVLRWACGALEHVALSVHPSLEEALAGIATVVGTASARGRENLPVLGPDRLAARLTARSGSVALVFGNETRGLPREALDRCDLVLRIPTAERFPVLNLAQAVAISVALVDPVLREPVPSGTPEPASHEAVEALMDHARRALLAIGFLDPVNPDRILRKLRRILGRAGATTEEVTILHGICRQILWAASNDLRPRDR